MSPTTLRLLTDEQVVQLFGDPDSYLNPDGTIAPAWEALILDVARLPEALPLSWNPMLMVTHLRVHRKLVGVIEAALDEIHKAGLWPQVHDLGGCYAWRTRRLSAHALSRHCWGAAIDLNVKGNPQGSPPTMDPGIVQAFEAQGFAWGGNFHGPSVDGMHFEAADFARFVAGPA